MMKHTQYPSQLDPDAPRVPKGKAPRPGVEYGCGEVACADCYEDYSARIARSQKAFYDVKRT